jgi:hypothetical protein
MVNLVPPVPTPHLYVLKRVLRNFWRQNPRHLPNHQWDFQESLFSSDFSSRVCPALKTELGKQETRARSLSHAAHLTPARNLTLHSSFQHISSGSKKNAQGHHHPDPSPTSWAVWRRRGEGHCKLGQEKGKIPAQTELRLQHTFQSFIFQSSPAPRHSHMHHFPSLFICSGTQTPAGSLVCFPQCIEPEHARQPDICLWQQLSAVGSKLK